MPTDAVIYTQPERLMNDLAVCTKYCTDLDYRVVAVVQGDWREAMDFLEDGRAQVLVAAGDDGFPSGGLPRVEIVSQMRRNRVRDIYRPSRNERPADANDTRRRRPRPIA